MARLKYLNLFNVLYRHEIGTKKRDHRLYKSYQDKSHLLCLKMKNRKHYKIKVLKQLQYQYISKLNDMLNQVEYSHCRSVCMNMSCKNTKNRESIIKKGNFIRF